MIEVKEVLGVMVNDQANVEDHGDKVSSKATHYAGWILGT